MYWKSWLAWSEIKYCEHTIIIPAVIIRRRQLWAAGTCFYIPFNIRSTHVRLGPVHYCRCRPQLAVQSYHHRPWYSGIYCAPKVIDKFELNFWEGYAWNKKKWIKSLEWSSTNYDHTILIKMNEKNKLDLVCRKREVSNSRPACRKAFFKFVALLVFTHDSRPMPMM